MNQNSWQVEEWQRAIAPTMTWFRLITQFRSQQLIWTSSRMTSRNKNPKWTGETSKNEKIRSNMRSRHSRIGQTVTAIWIWIVTMKRSSSRASCRDLHRSKRVDMDSLMTLKSCRNSHSTNLSSRSPRLSPRTMRWILTLRVKFKMSITKNKWVNQKCILSKSSRITPNFNVESCKCNRCSPILTKKSLKNCGSNRARISKRWSRQSYVSTDKWAILLSYRRTSKLLKAGNRDPKEPNERAKSNRTIRCLCSSWLNKACRKPKLKTCFSLIKCKQERFKTPRWRNKRRLRDIARDSSASDSNASRRLCSKFSTNSLQPRKAKRSSTTPKNSERPVKRKTRRASRQKT